MGKKEQGISVALQVEKTSKRGGRIIHEKPGGNVSPPPMANMMQDDFVAPAPPPPKPLQSITEIMKEQSKVKLCIIVNSFFSLNNLKTNFSKLNKIKIGSTAA